MWWITAKHDSKMNHTLQIHNLQQVWKDFSQEIAVNIPVRRNGRQSPRSLFQPMSASKVKVDTLNIFIVKQTPHKTYVLVFFALLCFFTFGRFGREIYFHPVYLAFRFIKDMKRNFQTQFFPNGVFKIVVVLNRVMDIITSLVSADSKNGDVRKGFGELK